MKLRNLSQSNCMPSPGLCFPLLRIIPQPVPSARPPARKRLLPGASSPCPAAVIASRKVSSVTSPAANPPFDACAWKVGRVQRYVWIHAQLSGTVCRRCMPMRKNAMMAPGTNFACPLVCRILHTVTMPAAPCSCSPVISAISLFHSTVTWPWQTRGPAGFFERKVSRRGSR